MESKNQRYILLALYIGFLAMLIWTGLLGVSHVQAQPPPPNDDDLLFIAFFTDDLSIQISDLSGNSVSEGTHGGKVKCNGNRLNCSQKTNIVLHQSVVFPTPYNIKYKFAERLALDPEGERAVLGGTGTIGIDGQKERFSFTATFQNNRDGTVSVIYDASRPDASFMIPNAPGSFSIRSR